MKAQEKENKSKQSQWGYERQMNESLRLVPDYPQTKFHLDKSGKRNYHIPSVFDKYH
tara:strand:- start:375 stop:545 length:171 start_codon:yes stop_codon:yes gene_type:complete